jgi:hypothetical protein
LNPLSRERQFSSVLAQIVTVGHQKFARLKRD